MSLYRLQPVFVERPWGVPDLAPLYPGHHVRRPVGEVWLTALECGIEVLPTALAAPTLGELWRSLSPQQRGAGAEWNDRFPLLVKFLFTADKLSIQLHPDDEFARRETGEPWGKSEAWHILSAEPGAWVRVGFRKGVTSEDVDRVWGDPAIEDWMDKLQLSPGDTVYVPAGTVHSVGPGLCLCEVQQYSDLTFRICDYDRPGLDGRPRPLHIEQARRAFRTPSPEAGVVTLPSPVDAAGVRTLVATPFFRLESVERNREWVMAAAPESVTLFVVTAGQGKVIAPEGVFAYKAGDAFLQLAGAAQVTWRPELATTCLRIRPAVRPA